MEYVVAQFIHNPDHYKQAAGHANSRTGNVDKRIPLVFFNVPQCDLKIILKHNPSPFLPDDYCPSTLILNADFFKTKYAGKR